MMPWVAGTVMSLFSVRVEGRSKTTRITHLHDFLGFLDDFRWGGNDPAGPAEEMDGLLAVDGRAHPPPSGRRSSRR